MARLEPYFPRSHGKPQVNDRRFVHRNGPRWWDAPREYDPHKTAWLGLVPRQFSSGGKERLGRTSEAGQADICRLLIIGAMSRLNWMGRTSIPEDSWLARITSGKPRMIVDRLSQQDGADDVGDADEK